MKFPVIHSYRLCLYSYQGKNHYSKCSNWLISRKLTYLVLPLSSFVIFSSRSLFQWGWMPRSNSLKIGTNSEEAHYYRRPPKSELTRPLLTAHWRGASVLDLPHSSEIIPYWAWNLGHKRVLEQKRTKRLSFWLTDESPAKYPSSFFYYFSLRQLKIMKIFAPFFRQFMRLFSTSSQDSPHLFRL